MSTVDLGTTEWPHWDSVGSNRPRGEPLDPSDAHTVCGLGNRKNAYFRTEVREHGVERFASTMALVADLRSAGVRVAAVSASENQGLVLSAAGVQDDFDVLIDGVMARDLGLAGKPDPALFLEAARRLGILPNGRGRRRRPLGVAAGHAGGFGVVIGVDRAGRPDELAAAGADLVVPDLGELQVGDGGDDGCWLLAGARS